MAHRPAPEAAFVLDGDADDEPSLGAPEARLPDGLAYVGSWIGAITQEHWSDGRGDLEEEEQHDAQDDPAEAGLLRRRGMNWRFVVSRALRWCAKPRSWLGSARRLKCQHRANSQNSPSAGNYAPSWCYTMLAGGGL